MKLHEVIGRGQWLELQQAMIEQGFDAELRMDDGERVLYVTGGCRRMSPTFKHEEYYFDTGFGGFWYSPVKKATMSLSVDKAVNMGCLTYLQRLRSSNVIEKSLNWLADYPLKLRELVSMLLEGEAEVTAAIVTKQFVDQQVADFAKRGWKLFFQSTPFMGSVNLVFIK